VKDKVIISAALTGAVTPKEKNPHLPVTPEEIAEDAYLCWKAGAAIVHIHMRDAKGIGTMDLERFEKSAKLIREKCDVVVNMTTSGARGVTDEERMAHIVKLAPEMGSFDAGSFNWMPDGVFTNSPQFLEKLGRVMVEKKVKPEIEVFDTGMVDIATYYAEQGVIGSPLHFQFVLGVLGGVKASVKNLVHLVDMIPEGATWSAFGVGRDHIPIMLATLALGGHIRVGLEDNIYYAKGVLASNVMLVERAVRLIKETNKTPATPDEARAILGLKGLQS